MDEAGLPVVRPTFLEALRQQRWDDHRYYHHSRINQSLHLVSALCFLATYVLLVVNPVAAVLLGWLVAMTVRQAGHFFFEPKGYDAVNHATHAHKESIKVGYNLFRKVVLLSVWALVPIVLLLDPTLFGRLEPHQDLPGYVRHVCMLWLCLGGAAIVFRMLQLFVKSDVQTGLVWVTKILTDPFHDVMLYWKAPYHLLRGQRIDPMLHARDAASALSVAAPRTGAAAGRSG